MTSETDEQFLDSMEQWVIGSLVFKREHRERLFALARRGAAVQWRPIEAAPKGGTPVLLCNVDEGFNEVGHWWVNMWAGGTGLDGLLLGIVTPIPLSFAPTHWMPLPPPPAGEPSDE